jgi:hypothetical protein
MTSWQEPSPRVSAIVIFLDAQQYLAEAIESVLAQTFTRWELILVDDGSTDNSRAIAESYASRDPARIRTLQHEAHVNRGMSASRNLGLRSARGAYIGFLDADDRWPPDKLACLVPLLESDERFAVVIGAIEFFGELPETSDRIVRPAVPVGTPLDAAQLLHATLVGRPRLLTTLGNPLMRRSALAEVGGLEDEFTGQAEDAVAWCKLALRFRFTAVADTVLHYRRHGLASGVSDLNAGTLAAGHARFARWLYDYVLREPPEVRAWAHPIVAEHLFQAVVLDAWFALPDDMLRRRARLIKAWRDLSLGFPDAVTPRRRLRFAAQVVAGLRSGAIGRLQEPDLCPEPF